MQNDLASTFQILHVIQPRTAGMMITCTDAFILVAVAMCCMNPMW
jgi:hypothetical protein